MTGPRKKKTTKAHVRNRQLLVSWTTRMAPPKKVRNKLGFGNHILMAMQTQTFNITLDVEQPAAAASAGRFLPSDLETLKDDERVVLKVWQRRDGSSKHHQGWRETRRYRLEEIKIEKENGQTVKVQFGVGRALVARQVKFENPEDALRFHSVVQKVTQLERDRGKRQLEKYRSSQENLASMKYSDRIQALVQIVSITDIPKDVIPYVAIKIGGKVLHRTEYASSETGSVIYTLEEGCFFVLNMPLLEFFCSTGGMTFLVKDQDRVAVEGKAIGRAIVPINGEC
jgi:hypothetical protein